jgi:hypothetical protein
MIEVEREPLPEPIPQMEPTPALEEVAPKEQVRQLTMTDLFQRHGAQATGSARRKAKAIAVQQLSLFGGQAAAAA